MWDEYQRRQKDVKSTVFLIEKAQLHAKQG